MTTVSQRFEHPQAALTARIEHADRCFVALQRLPQSRRALLGAAQRPLPLSQSLCDDLAMRAGVLPDVERREMKAESADATNEASHLEQACVLALVGAQAVGDQVQIAEKLVGRIVVV